MKLLTMAKTRKNYYVTVFEQGVKVTFFPYYGNDFKSEYEAKKAAFSDFRQFGCNGDTLQLEEHNGMQIADKSEPFLSKSAIIKVLAIRSV